MKPAKPTTAAKNAFSHLPPDLQDGLKSLGFTPARVEPSGALAFRTANNTSVAAKLVILAGFRKTAQSYGLDLQRVSFGQGVGVLWDDGSLLVNEADACGRRPRLFDEDGHPSQEVLRESSARLRA
jgi:hypothetical protein